MEYFFDHFEEFQDAARKAGHTVFLSDYDGTLTPITGRPQDAILLPGVRRNLEALAANPAFTLGIISGRILSNVRELVKIPDIYYSGNHGLEIAGPGWQWTHPQAIAAQDIMQAIGQRFQTAAAHIEGVIIENKILTVSLHYRLVNAERLPEVEKAYREIITPYLAKGQVRANPGKMVWEIRPPTDWNKGNAVQMIVNQVREKHPDPMLVYLGDDTTDEDVFRQMGQPPREWGILVGDKNKSSSAAYYLDSAYEVFKLLERLVNL